VGLLNCCGSGFVLAKCQYRYAVPGLVPWAAAYYQDVSYIMHIITKSTLITGKYIPRSASGLANSPVWLAGV